MDFMDFKDFPDFAINSILNTFVYTYNNGYGTVHQNRCYN
jgi:hypothetical protein